MVHHRPPTVGRTPDRLELTDRPGFTPFAPAGPFRGGSRRPAWGSPPGHRVEPAPDVFFLPVGHLSCVGTATATAIPTSRSATTPAGKAPQAGHRLEEDHPSISGLGPHQTTTLRVRT